jgi:hypothetical protein
MLEYWGWAIEMRWVPLVLLRATMREGSGGGVC